MQPESTGVLSFMYSFSLVASFVSSLCASLSTFFHSFTQLGYNKVSDIVVL
jgi:hypothetical protein